jgi:hypothetical protein
MKNCDGCGQQTMNEFAWLIEADGSYWDGHYPDKRGFVPDVNKAVRFSRFEDAEAVKWWILQSWAFALRTTQHGWSNAAPITSEEKCRLMEK